jgi:hypothetical protein
MAQYTQCANFDDWKDHGAVHGHLWPLIRNGWFSWGTLGFAVLGAALGFVFGGFIGLGVGASIGISYAFTDGFCDQWLNWRLICVQKDQCLIGKVEWIETMDKKGDVEWLFDNDLSFNVRLIPYSSAEFDPANLSSIYPLESSLSQPNSISNDNFPAYQILRKPKNPDGSDWDIYSYKGYALPDKAEDPVDLYPDHPGGRWTVHSEIEGNGMHILCIIAKVLALLGPLGQAIGIIGTAALGAYEGAKLAWDLVHSWCGNHWYCHILAAIAAIVGAIVGAVVGAVLGSLPGLGQIIAASMISSLGLRSDGSWSDVANDPDSGTIHEEDCIFVAGDEVFDSGHDAGWIEIHPVRHLQKINSYEGCPNALTGSSDFGTTIRNEVITFWDKWCKGYATSKDPVVIASQQDPTNLWCIHPLIDGCQPVIG